VSKKKKGQLKDIPKEALEKAKELLSYLDEREQGIDISDPHVAIAFLELIPKDSKAVPYILEIKKRFKDKGVNKAVRRALFRLKQKGISVEDSEKRDERPIIIKEAPKDSVLISPVDFFGQRGIFLELSMGLGNYAIGMGIIGVESGIINFFYSEYKRKDKKRAKEIFLDHFKENIEIPLSYGVYLLERAYEKSSKTLTDAIRDYTQIRPILLEREPPLKRSPIYELYNENEVSEHLITYSSMERLLSHELMLSWLISPEEIEPYLEKIKEAEEGIIVLSEAQKAERIDDIKRRSITELFNSKRRSILKTALEDMAYYLYLRGEEHLSKLAFGASLTLRGDQRESLYMINPFLEALFEKSIEYYEALKSIDQKEPLIYQPEDFDFIT